MSIKILLPNHFKKVGWALFIIGLILSFSGVFGSDYYFFEGDHIFKDWTAFSSKLPSIWDSIAENEGLKIEKHDFAGEIIITLVLIGFLLIAFSREKQEDEYIAKIRAESLVWGLYVYFLCLLLVIWIFYSLLFLLILNWIIFVPLIVFIVRFHWFVYVKPYLEERRTAA